MLETLEQRPTRREVLPYNGIRANAQPLCPEFWGPAARAAADTQFGASHGAEPVDRSALDLASPSSLNRASAVQTWAMASCPGLARLSLRFHSVRPGKRHSSSMRRDLYLLQYFTCWQCAQSVVVFDILLPTYSQSLHVIDEWLFLCDRD